MRRLIFKKSEKWNILKHLSRSNKVVLDWSDSVQFVWMSVLTGRAVVKLRKHHLLSIQRLWGAHRKIHLEFLFFCFCFFSQSILSKYYHSDFYFSVFHKYILSWSPINIQEKYILLALVTFSTKERISGILFWTSFKSIIKPTMNEGQGFNHFYQHPMYPK